jgi:hypothetical protein
VAQDRELGPQQGKKAGSHIQSPQWSVWGSADHEYFGDLFFISCCLYVVAISFVGKKDKNPSQVQWLTSVILVTQEAEIRRIRV